MKIAAMQEGTEAEFVENYGADWQMVGSAASGRNLDGCSKQPSPVVRTRILNGFESKTRAVTMLIRNCRQGRKP